MVRQRTLTNTGGSSSASKSSSHGAAQRTPELEAKDHGLSKSDRVIHNIANGTAKKAKTKVASRTVAGKAIPMNDGNSGRDDVEEFNR